MKKLCKPLALFLALLFLLASCAPGESPPDSAEVRYTFTDSAGYTVTVKKNPTRVAVLLSSFADVWGLAGGKVAITVGESVERGFCDNSVTLVDDGAGKTINAEVLIASAPDFVILSTDIPAQVETAALCREAGIPVAQMRVECFAEYLTLLKVCTDLTGRPELYELHGTAQKAQIDAVLAKKPLNGMRILFIRAGSSARSVKPKGSADHFAAAMLKELGATNIADDAPVLAEGLSMEAILAADPDYIFFTAMGDEDASRTFVAEMLKGEDWAALSAVKSGSFSYLPKDLFHYKPNRAWANAYTHLIQSAKGV